MEPGRGLGFRTHARREDSGPGSDTSFQDTPRAHPCGLNRRLPVADGPGRKYPPRPLNTGARHPEEHDHKARNASSSVLRSRSTCSRVMTIGGRILMTLLCGPEVPASTPRRSSLVRTDSRTRARTDSSGRRARTLERRKGTPQSDSRRSVGTCRRNSSHRSLRSQRP